MKKILFWVIGALILLVLVVFMFIPVFGGRLQINPIINFGFIQIRWYGLILAASILASYFVARKNAWRFGISPADVDDFSFWLVIIGILGARLYYVLFNWSYYWRNPSEIYQIWHGGLSIYGSILSGLVFVYFYVRKKAYGFYQLFDLLALSLPLGQAIGRLGNFVNQEAFGLPTNLPWKMYVAPLYRPPEFISYNFFHPTFLYEALWSIVVFLILWKLLGRLKSGGLGWSYLLLYSLGRFFIESIRLDSFFISGFRVDQVVAFLLIVVSGFVILRKQAQTR